jgi:hypothetical protein
VSKPARFQLIGASAVIGVIAALLFASHSAHASGAILPPAGSTDPEAVDVEIAVAVTPFGATRWSRLTTSGASTVMWLVPAHPGAALDWASDAWLGALHHASTPRVAPPTATPPCGMSGAPQRTASWGSTGAKKFPRAVTIHPSESEFRAHVTSRGFEVSTTSAARIIEAYAKGYALVSLELDTGGAMVSTPTLRVSDDGAGIIPLALTGNRQTNARVTAMVIGEGGALLPGARDLDADGLIWGGSGVDDLAIALSGTAPTKGFGLAPHGIGGAGHVRARPADQPARSAPQPGGLRGCLRRVSGPRTPSGRRNHRAGRHRPRAGP